MLRSKQLFFFIFIFYFFKFFLINFKRINILFILFIYSLLFPASAPEPSFLKLRLKRLHWQEDDKRYLQYLVVGFGLKDLTGTGFSDLSKSLGRSR